MKTTEKQQIIGVLGDIEKAELSFRVLKERLQLDRDDILTDKTVLRLISEKRQMMYLASIIDEYLNKAKMTINGVTR